jgi:hypothetical protein
MTHREAIEKLVELDVAKWGEAERDASRRAHSRRSHALAVNAVANATGDEALRAEAKRLMTPADKRLLRSAL